MTQDAILDRVRKLLRLAGNNPNPEEAATAAAKAQALIDAHHLSRALLDLDPQGRPGGAPAEEPIEDLGRAPLDPDGRRSRVRVTLASVVARANACRVYLSGGGVCLIGRPSDAETVRYLYAWLRAEVDRLTRAHGRGLGTVWRNNFGLGVVDTVARKLREQREAQRAQARAEAEADDARTRAALAASSAGPLFADVVPAGALVRVNAALAALDDRGPAVDAWTQQHMTLRAGRGGGGRTDYGARQAGRQAGESINVGGGGRRLTAGAARLRA